MGDVLGTMKGREREFAALESRVQELSQKNAQLKAYAKQERARAHESEATIKILKASVSASSSLIAWFHKSGG